MQWKKRPETLRDVHFSLWKAKDQQMIEEDFHRYDEERVSGYRGTTEDVFDHVTVENQDVDSQKWTFWPISLTTSRSFEDVFLIVLSIVFGCKKCRYQKKRWRCFFPPRKSLTHLVGWVSQKHHLPWLFHQDGNGQLQLTEIRGVLEDAGLLPKSHEDLRCVDVEGKLFGFGDAVFGFWIMFGECF